MATNGNGSNGTSKALVSSKKSKVDGLKGLLTKALPAIQAAAPKHLTPERIVQTVVAQASRTPALLEATPVSLLNCVMVSAELGLMPGAALGQAYFVPFRNRGSMEVQLIVGYRGLLQLARRSGEIKAVSAQLVYKGEAFEWVEGTDRVLTHKPDLSKRPTVSSPKEAEEHVVAVYAIADLKDGGQQIDVMGLADVERIRQRSKAGSSGPWQSDWSEMARKTVLRRLLKYCPASVDMQRALALDAKDYGETVDPEELGFGTVNDDAIDAEYEEVEGGKGNGKPSLKEKLAAEKAAREADEPPPPDDDGPEYDPETGEVVPPPQGRPF